MHLFRSIEQNFLLPSPTFFPCFLLFLDMISLPHWLFSLTRQVIFCLLVEWSPTHSLSMRDLSLLLSEFLKFFSLCWTILIRFHEFLSMTLTGVHIVKKTWYKMVLHCIYCFQMLFLHQGQFQLQDLSISVSRHHIITLKSQYEWRFFCHLICISAFTAITLDHVISVTRCGSLFLDNLFIPQINIYCWGSCYIVLLIYFIARLL